MFIFLQDCFKNYFSTKEIIVISSKQIKRKKITKINKVINLLFFIWFSFATFFVIRNKKFLDLKNIEIKELKNLNSSLYSNINELNIIFDNVKDYLISLNQYDRFNKIDIKQISSNENFLVDKFLMSKTEYKKILPIITSVERNINLINEVLDNRVKSLNSIVKISPQLKLKAEELYKEQHLLSVSELLIHEKNNLISFDEENNKIHKINDKIKYLNFLESFLNSVPTSKPLNDYYISSKFGTRIDPFKKTAKFHNGVDLVGAHLATIKSPANGVVEEISKNPNGYGLSVVINHGNDIKTRFAHLSSVTIKQGDSLKKGQEVAKQGNSGKSTSEHTHHEVILNKEYIDPLKFYDIEKRLSSY